MRGEAAGQAPSVPHSEFLRWRPIFSLLPSALAFVISANTLWNGFAADDSHQVLQNTLIKKLSNIPLAFTKSVWAFVTEDIVFSVDQYYRPLFSLLFTINYALFGTRAWGWHLVNLLIHAVVAWLVFISVKELTDRKWLALITASLFAAHPAHAESVAWISGITDPMMTVFILASFYFYIRYHRERRGRFLWMMLAAYFLALLCKETAIALPLIVGACELFYFSEATPLKHRIYRATTLSSLFLLPTLADILMRYGALGRLVGGARTIPLLVGLATIPIATVKYLVLMLVPVGYSYQHQTNFVLSIRSAQFLGPIVILATAAACIRLSKSRLLGMAGLWFLAPLAPALYAIRSFEPENVVQERYLYVPSIGFCLAIAVGVEWLVRRKPFESFTRPLGLSITLVLLALWSVVSIRQNLVWDNDLSLYRNVVMNDPGRATAHVALALSYQSAGRMREADNEIHTAIDLDPSDSRPYVTLAYFANALGKYNDAVGYLERAAALAGDRPYAKNDLATVYLNIGLISWQTKDYQRAEENLRRSIEVWPRAVGWYHAGRFYFDRGRLDEARVMFELAAQHVPETYPPIHLQLGRVYDLIGQKGQAKSEYEKFLNLAPPEAANRSEVMARLQNL